MNNAATQKEAKMFYATLRQFDNADDTDGTLVDLERHETEEAATIAATDLLNEAIADYPLDWNRYGNTAELEDGYRLVAIVTSPKF